MPPLSAPRNNSPNSPDLDPSVRTVPDAVQPSLPNSPDLDSSVSTLPSGARTAFDMVNQPSPRGSRGVKAYFSNLAYQIGEFGKKQAGMKTDAEMALEQMKMQLQRDQLASENRLRNAQINNLDNQNEQVTVFTASGQPMILSRKAAEKFMGASALEGQKQEGRVQLQGPQVPVTPTMAQKFGLPLGSSVPLNTYAKLNSAEGKNLVKTDKIMEDGKSHMVVLDKVTGEVAHDLGLSADYKKTIDRAWAFAVARRENQVDDVYDQNGNLVPMSAGDRLRAGLPKAQTEFSQQGPTGSTRTAGQAAEAVSSHIPDYLKSVDALAAKGELGAVMGRLNEYMNSGYFGDDPDIAKFVADTKLIQSGTVRAHFGAKGGAQILENFNRIINTKQEPEAIRGAVASIKSWLDKYGDIGKFKPTRAGSGSSAPSSGGGIKTADDYLKKFNK